MPCWGHTGGLLGLIGGLRGRIGGLLGSIGGLKGPTGGQLSPTAGHRTLQSPLAMSRAQHCWATHALLFPLGPTAGPRALLLGQMVINMAGEPGIAFVLEFSRKCFSPQFP